MTDSMIERVARALTQANGFSPDDIWQNPDGEPVPRWTQYAVFARAAIEAMRTPTQAMSDAVTEAHIGVGEHWLNSGDAECVWPVMIDAALNEKAGT